MSLPRQVIPGRFYMITRRCTQRRFLLSPDEETNNTFLYCLADAAQRCNITVLLTCALSNHHHTVIFDPDGTVPAFTEHFHKLLAKCQNAWHGRWGNFWASEQVCVVHLVDLVDVMHKLVYVATNPVKDRLVDAVARFPASWPRATPATSGYLVPQLHSRFLPINPGPVPRDGEFARAPPLHPFCPGLPEAPSHSGVSRRPRGASVYPPSDRSPNWSAGDHDARFR